LSALTGKTACQGYGKCEKIAADTFKSMRRVLRTFRSSEISLPEKLGRAKAAAKRCPANAIGLVETVTGRNDSG
jgi:ferredoxin